MNYRVAQINEQNGITANKMWIHFSACASEVKSPENHYTIRSTEFWHS